MSKYPVPCQNADSSSQKMWPMMTETKDSAADDKMIKTACSFGMNHHDFF
jgi:hypothetical protein